MERLDPLVALVPLGHALATATSIDVFDLRDGLALVALVADAQGSVLGFQLGSPAVRSVRTITAKDAVDRVKVGQEIAVLHLVWALTAAPGLVLRPLSGLSSVWSAGMPMSLQAAHPQVAS